MRTALLPVFLILFVCGATPAQTPGAGRTERNYPAPIEGDLVIPNFHFRSGESLPELKIHYRTIGTAKRLNNFHAELPMALSFDSTVGFIKSANYRGFQYINLDQRLPLT